MTVPASTVFRPRRYNKALCGVAVFLCLVFIAAGVACFLVIGLHLFSFGFTLIGLIAAAAAIGSMFTRTLVSAEGISKRPTIAGGFILRWSDVDSWEQRPRRFDDARCIRFRVRGSRFARVVFDYEVEQPGFESFVSYVRQYVSQKEAT